jgi:hypothetical protein
MVGDLGKPCPKIFDFIDAVEKGNCMYCPELVQLRVNIGC